MTTIEFDLNKFKDFLKILEEFEMFTDCKTPIDYTVKQYYIDKKGFIKVKRICYMLDESIKTDNEWKKYIKGKIKESEIAQSGGVLDSY